MQRVRVYMRQRHDVVRVLHLVHVRLEEEALEALLGVRPSRVALVLDGLRELKLQAPTPQHQKNAKRVETKKMLRGKTCY